MVLTTSNAILGWGRRPLFENYRLALLNADGKTAAEIVCSQTTGWYERAGKDALSLAESALRQTDIMRKFSILRMRLEFTTDQLERMDGKKLFSHAVDKGWIGSAMVRNIQLHRIEIQGNQAEGYVKNSPNTPAFHFIKEKANGNSQWKLSLVKSFPLARKVFERIISSSGMEEDQWIAATLTTLSKKKVDLKELYSKPATQ